MNPFEITDDENLDFFRTSTNGTNSLDDNNELSLNITNIKWCYKGEPLIVVINLHICMFSERFATCTTKKGDCPNYDMFENKIIQGGTSGI